MKTIDITDYMYYKCVQSLVYDKDALNLISEGDYDLHIFSNEFLDGLYSFVKYMSENNYFEKDYKDNVLDIIMYMRNSLKGTEDYSLLIDRLNEIVRMINKSNDSNSEQFYLNEMGIRLGFLRNKGKNVKLDDRQYEKCKTIVLESISNDYSVLLFNLDRIDDETFKNDFVPAFSMNALYYYSLRALFVEKPELASIIKLRERVNLMLNYNTVNLDKTRINKKVKKEIQNETRKFRKFI